MERSLLNDRTNWGLEADLQYTTISVQELKRRRNETGFETLLE